MYFTFTHCTTYIPLVNEPLQLRLHGRYLHNDLLLLSVAHLDQLHRRRPQVLHFDVARLLGRRQRVRHLAHPERRKEEEFQTTG
jgi:hypothetical protein